MQVTSGLNLPRESSVLQSSCSPGRNISHVHSDKTVTGNDLNNLNADQECTGLLMSDFPDENESSDESNEMVKTSFI